MSRVLGTPLFSRAQASWPKTRTSTLHTSFRPVRHFTSTPRASQFGRSNFRYQQFAPARRGLVNLFRRWSNRPTFYYEAAGVAAAGGGVVLYNTDEVPVSGRRRFNMIPPSFEAQLGVQQYQQVLEQYRGRILSDSDPRTRQVRRVLERLIPNSGLPADYKWEVNVIESEETNAFVIPGGKVFVFTGILPICGNDDGLAAVLGHEVGHNVARHVAEKLSKSGIFAGLAVAGEYMLGIPGVISQQLLGIAMELPNSRAQEVCTADNPCLLHQAKSHTLVGSRSHRSYDDGEVLLQSTGSSDIMAAHATRRGKSSCTA